MMDNDEYHRLVLEMSSISMQTLGHLAGEYPEGSHEAACYESGYEKANKLFHAAWDRVHKKER